MDGRATVSLTTAVQGRTWEIGLQGSRWRGREGDCDGHVKR